MLLILYVCFVATDKAWIIYYTMGWSTVDPAAGPELPINTLMTSEAESCEDCFSTTHQHLGAKTSHECL